MDEAAATLTVTLRRCSLPEAGRPVRLLRAVVSWWPTLTVQWTYDRLCGLGSKAMTTPLQTEFNWAGSAEDADQRGRTRRSDRRVPPDLRRRGHRGEFHDSVHQDAAPSGTPLTG